jgi:hypothetical protein
MSLKNVHLVFITAAAALALFCAVQAFGSYRDTGSMLSAVATVGALAVAALLVRYETLFLKRCRAEGIR